MGAVSIAGPIFAMSIRSGYSQNTTQCGFPIETQVISYVAPYISTALATILSPGSLTGIFAGSSSALPISTVTDLTFSPRT